MVLHFPFVRYYVNNPCFCHHILWFGEIKASLLLYLLSPKDIHLYTLFVRQKDLGTRRWSYVSFKNIYSILSSFKLHPSVKHSTHWRNLNPKPVQFELISVFLQKNMDCFFCLQSNWWPCIDHIHFLYLTTLFLFLFQTSACFTDGQRILSIPFHTRKCKLQVAEVTQVTTNANGAM